VQVVVEKVLHSHSPRRKIKRRYLYH